MKEKNMHFKPTKVLLQLSSCYSYLCIHFFGKVLPSRELSVNSNADGTRGGTSGGHKLVTKWSPSCHQVVPKVVPKWSTSDLSVSHLIST